MLDAAGWLSSATVDIDYDIDGIYRTHAVGQGKRVDIVVYEILCQWRAPAVVHEVGVAAKHSQHDIIRGSPGLEEHDVGGQGTYLVDILHGLLHPVDKCRHREYEISIYRHTDGITYFSAVVAVAEQLITTTQFVHDDPQGISHRHALSHGYGLGNPVHGVLCHGCEFESGVLIPHTHLDRIRQEAAKRDLIPR